MISYKKKEAIKRRKKKGHQFLFERGCKREMFYNSQGTTLKCCISCFGCKLVLFRTNLKAIEIENSRTKRKAYTTMI